ncbi:MAG: CHC2 zinc finger domain-containing protein [Lachnospiraceae bacterium]|nr:CHC2 zinc finger domain-containing protein [Lachnospiraceae bacterium]
MNKEEIKERYSMNDIVAMYDMRPNRAGMVRCPFHSGDREPSMKVYKRDYHCFGCGANGDIFDFIQNMDNLTFKEAFARLGGSYEQTKESTFKLYHAQKKRDMQEKQKMLSEKNRRLNCSMISIYRRWIRKLTPYSSEWCECQNELVKQIAIFEETNGLR